MNNKTFQQDVFYVQKDNLSIVPVCHYRMEFSYYVQGAAEAVQPDAVAVELPSTLEDLILEAVQRFPYLSVIFYQNGAGDYVYFPIEPTDPLAEAVRTGLQMKVPTRCIDLDTDDYPLMFDPMPDSYSVHKIGLEKYYKLYRAMTASGKRPSKRDPRDDRREETMAYHLQQMMKRYEKVLFVCGMAHVESVLKKLDRVCVQPIGKAIRKDIRLFNLSLNSIREVTGEIPFLMSTYEMDRGEHDLEKEIKKNDSPGEKEDKKIISLQEAREKRNYSTREKESPKKQKSELIKFPLSPKVKQNQQYSESIRKISKLLPPKTPGQTTLEREINQFQEITRKIFSKLFQLPDKPAGSKIKDQDSEKLFFDQWLSFQTPGPFAGREKVHKFKKSIDRREEMMRLYNDLADKGCRDRQELIIKLVKTAAQYYRENVNEEISSWQIETFMKYARNYSRVKGALLPDLYQLVVCARGCADDNFAYEVWDLATYYPWIDKSGKYQTVDIKADQVWLFGKKITLRRKFPYLRKRLVNVPLPRRKDERKPGEWAEEFKKGWICSYPPDDIVIENYGTYLKKKGMNILSEENTRVIPFTTSLLDGIDVRETLRNWHEKKIYVREKLHLKGGVGSVVVIFDEDKPDTKFPWKLTWLGEHYQESDMAFYSTHPADKIIGPGISRCTYGGFMMTYPPGRVYDVWIDPFYATARSKPEVLLMSAIEYSTEKNVVYAAPKPPRSYFKTFASRLNKRIIYIPLGTLSPVTIKKIRVFHVLAGHKVREYAKEYVW